jgi:hypothetical protein
MMRAFHGASSMLLDWKSIEYIVLGVLCVSIIAALFFAKY